MEKMRVGILGAGRIAGVMASTLSKMKNAECYAIASNTKGKAEIFAHTYQIQKYYTDYLSLIQDKDVDLIYIATTNNCHKENALMCLDYDKAILVEKPFCINYEEAKEVLDKAKERKVFVAEAMLVRYSDLYRYIYKIINKGIIGDVNLVSANLGLKMQNITRLTEKKLGGGALLDLGVYLLHFTDMIFHSEPEAIISDCIKSETDIDEQNSIIIRYKERKIAMLNSAITYTSDAKGIIQGTEGYIVVDNIYNYTKVRVYKKNKLVSYKKRKHYLNGYEAEIDACNKALLNEKTQCTELPHTDTLKIMQQLDQIRMQWR